MRMDMKTEKRCLTKTVEIILGPTGVGKTDFAVRRALECGSPVISCDSRQIFKEMTIGTAVPDASQLAAVKHYFIHSNSIMEDYTAGRYEIEAHRLVEALFAQGHERLIMCGGSGFYIDAFVNGLDDFPPADQSLRAELSSRLREEGVGELVRQLRALDPESCGTIDLANGQRVVRALEVCLMTGRKFSSFKTSPSRSHDFAIKKTGLTRPKEELYSRIDARVLRMIDDGLVEEARSLLPFRERPALQTVGYKELFVWFDFLDGRNGSDSGACTPGAPGADGKAGGGITACEGIKAGGDGSRRTVPGDGPVTTLDRAVELIQRNSRRYAKRQMSWWRRDPSIRWTSLND